MYREYRGDFINDCFLSDSMVKRSILILSSKSILSHCDVVRTRDLHCFTTAVEHVFVMSDAIDTFRIMIQK